VIKCEREVFANKKSVQMEEHYTAYQYGLDTRAVFEIRTEEYNEERVIKHDEKYYTVVRVREGGDFVDLTCTKRHGVFEEARA